MNKLQILLLFSIIKPSETPVVPKGNPSPTHTHMFSMAVPFAAALDENDISPWSTSICRSASSLRGSLIWQVPRDHEGPPFVAEQAPDIVNNFLRQSIGEVEELIDRKELAVNQRYGTMGNTLLMYAVLKDRQDLCKLLIAKNANINMRNKYQLSALQWARINGSRKDIIELLLKSGAE